MIAQGPIHFVLTLKGIEELASRTYRLDVKLRNILFLIQKGSANFEAIVHHSIFPREEVLERVRGLVNEKFIALSGGGSPAPEAERTAAAAPTLDRPIKQDATGRRTIVQTGEDSFPTLDLGASTSQARFVLCDYCLDQFGTKAQEQIDAINGANGIAGVQRVLDDIYEELRGRSPDQLSELAARVREINETKV
jgi:hypothetical protein